MGSVLVKYASLEALSVTETLGETRVCIKKYNIFIFQLQSETCNTFVTLLNKIVKNTVDKKYTMDTFQSTEQIWLLN